MLSSGTLKERMMGRGKAGKERGDGEEGEEGEEADGREERKTQELTTAAPTKK
jgi:hypothetical protein